MVARTPQDHNYSQVSHQQNTARPRVFQLEVNHMQKGGAGTGSWICTKPCCLARSSRTITSARRTHTPGGRGRGLHVFLYSTSEKHLQSNPIIEFFTVGFLSEWLESTGFQ